jgi:hypothetical protein
VTYDLETFTRQFFALCDASTWSEVRRIIDGLPALVEVNSDALLFGLIDRAERLGDTAAAGSLEQASTFLQRCRDVGTDTAFAEMSRHAKMATNLEQLFREPLNDV